MYSEGKTPSMELLEQLKYTGSVIKETLRINPPVPGGFRVALKTFELNVSQVSEDLAEFPYLGYCRQRVCVW